MQDGRRRLLGRTQLRSIELLGAEVTPFVRAEVAERTPAAT